MGELDVLKRDLALSFAKIKEDMQKKDEQLQLILKENRKLQERIAGLEKRKFPDGKIKEFNEKIRKLETTAAKKTDSEPQQLQQLLEKINALEKNQEGIKKMIKTAIRETATAEKPKTGITRKLDRNRKTIVKNQILNTIQEKELTIPELKEIIVDEQRFCSKATFYRYIERLKHCYNCVKIGEREVLVLKKQEIVR